MWRALASNMISILIVSLALLAGAVAWGQREWTGPGPLSQAICLSVERGSTMADVAQSLEAEGAVTSPRIFRIGTDYAGRTGLLKAGSFRVPERASMDEISEIVTRGGASSCGTEVVYRIGVADAEIQVRELDPASNRFEEVARFAPGEGTAPAEYEAVRASDDARYRIALAEGVTSWQVVDALSRADFLTGDVPAVPAEGSLAPDSYEVVPGTARGEVIAAMEASQRELLAEAWEARDRSVPLASPEEALILASIVEKETALPEERPDVAGVFVNRLRAGMRLQTDPTVIYGITRGEGVLGRGLRRSELDAETPWNTYRIDGLPPTPIANPGRESLMAATRPAETDYVYFVADGSGGHAFASTLEEHNRNVARWRQIEAEAEARN